MTSRMGDGELPAACRFNNSLGNDFTHYVGLSGVVERLARSFESCIHCGKRLVVKRHSRLQELTNWHRCYPMAERCH